LSKCFPEQVLMFDTCTEIDAKEMKRIFDITLSGIAIIAFTIPMLLVGLLVRVLLGAPIVFWQMRPGRHGRPFHVLKFRTMTADINSDGNLLSDSERLPKFGQILRSTSLDELPELWNVLKGEMSLVGPRPLLMEYLPLYSAEQARRHEIRPGITGWAQVNGRNALSWEEKFAMDVWYVDNQSLLLDCKILLMTLIKVMKRDGISQDGEATMRKFTGSD
jgi:lipopolysaccharide/colanic/teichoic acid biosynthesis glycosyltransferase